MSHQRKKPITGMMKIFPQISAREIVAALFVLFAMQSSPSLAANGEQEETSNTGSYSVEQENEYSLPPEMEAQLLDDMLWVEGGSFDMGSDAAESRPREQPVHQVTLDGFYIGKTELTQDIFEQIMGWNVSYFDCDKCAVNNISWLNVQLFIQRLNRATGKNFNLPTEAQWEYAAKGGQKSKDFLYSGSNQIDDVAWYADNALNRSHPVGQRKPNELGLYDMTGNLWEFCRDDMSVKAYSITSANNPLYTASKTQNMVVMKVIRGGGYEFSANESEVFKRDGASSNVRMPDIGFRLVLTEK